MSGHGRRLRSQRSNCGADRCRGGARCGRAAYHLLGRAGRRRGALSRHLRSRHEVGEVLRSGVPVTEFRAAMILGSGSASFEMMRYLTERLPVMIAPKWVSTLEQPIRFATSERISCRNSNFPGTAASSRDRRCEVLTPEAMMLRLREHPRPLAQDRRRPLLHAWLCRPWVLNADSSAIARPLIDGLTNKVVVRDDALVEFPTIHRFGVRRRRQAASTGTRRRRARRRRG